MANSIFIDAQDQIRIPAQPLALDSCYVENWGSGVKAAILNPEAGLHEQLAWLYAQIYEIKELLWGYISIPGNNDGEAAGVMAHSLCNLIEIRTTTMLPLLEQMCKQSFEVPKASTKRKGA